MDLAEQMITRDGPFWMVRKTNLVSDWNHARLVRLKVHRGLINAKKNYINQEIDQNNGDGKNFRRIIGDTFLNTLSSNIYFIHQKGTTYVLFREKAADEIVNYFWCISKEVSANFEPVSNSEGPNTEQSSNNLDGPCTMDMVSDEIRKGIRFQGYQ